MASVSFPVIGTKEYRNAFNAYAREQGHSMAELVRAALDKEYGEELKPYLSFFASDGLKLDQLDNKETTHA